MSVMHPALCGFCRCEPSSSWSCARAAPADISSPQGTRFKRATIMQAYMTDLLECGGMWPPGSKAELRGQGSPASLLLTPPISSSGLASIWGCVLSVHYPWNVRIPTWTTDFLQKLQWFRNYLPVTGKGEAAECIHCAQLHLGQSTLFLSFIIFILTEEAAQANVGHVSKSSTALIGQVLFGRTLVTVFTMKSLKFSAMCS